MCCNLQWSYTVAYKLYIKAQKGQRRLRLYAMYVGLELLLSNEKDRILPRLDSSGNGSIIKDEGPTSYNQVSQAIAAGGA